MGIYLNPGNDGFRRIVSSDVYVDKTMMIDVTNRFIDKGNSYVCVSRPRRFGKTFAGNMLCAYYSKGCDSSKLFAGFKIAKTAGFAAKLNRYNVIKIDMNSEYQNTLDKDKLMKRLNREIVCEIADAFPNVRLEEDDSLAQSILRVY